LAGLLRGLNPVSKFNPYAVGSDAKSGVIEVHLGSKKYQRVLASGMEIFFLAQLRCNSKVAMFEPKFSDANEEQGHPRRKL
jgi:hypothetical protein